MFLYINVMTFRESDKVPVEKCRLSKNPAELQSFICLNSKALADPMSDKVVDIPQSCSHFCAVRNISQGVVSSLKVLISL